MKKITIALLAGVGLIGSACQIPVPANEAAFGTGMDRMTFRFPLDADITGLELKGPKGLYLKADRWRSKNNPEVINQSAEGGAKLIEATGNAIAKNSEAIVAGVVKGAK